MQLAQVALAQGLFHVAADGTLGQLQLAGDLDVAHAIELAVEEGGLDDCRQAIEHLVNGQQGFDQEQLLFGRRGDLFGQQGQAFEVGMFQLTAAVAVEDQPSGDGREVGAWLPDAVRIDPRPEHLAERFGRSVFGIGAIAQAPVDVLEQPAVMVAEKEAQLAGRGAVQRLISDRECESFSMVAGEVVLSQWESIGAAKRPQRSCAQAAASTPSNSRSPN